MFHYACRNSSDPVQSCASFAEQANTVKEDIRYAHMEAGHAAQNVYLLGVELGIGTCAVGAFEDEEVRKVLKLPANEEPLYILPLGYMCLST